MNDVFSDAVTLHQLQQALFDICDEYEKRGEGPPPIKWVAYEMGLPVIAVLALMKSMYEGCDER